MTRFSALVKAMRTSCRTFELFEIARLIEKYERFVVVITRRPPEAPRHPIVRLRRVRQARRHPNRPSRFTSRLRRPAVRQQERLVAHAVRPHLDRYFDKRLGR